MNVQKNSEKGFTIIEVVLVLAIAGLIFLMVFIALPALQRSQRDSARKSEASAVVSAIGTYQGNNRGGNPTTAAQIGDIVNGKGATLDSGATVQLRSTAYSADRSITADTKAAVAPDTVAASDEVLVYLGYKCPATGSTIIKGTARQAAVLVIQESGNGQVFCQSS